MTTSIQHITRRLNIWSREADGHLTFHSQGMNGLCLADLVALERELRQEWVRSLMPTPQPNEYWNRKSRQDELIDQRDKLQAAVDSLMRKTTAGSPGYDRTLGDRLTELKAVSSELATFDPLS